jgi:cytochrome o ubiquinol oxidase subunit II
MPGPASRRVSSLRPIAAIALTAAAGGCSLAEAPILDPGGPVALAERDVLFRAFAIMMVVVIPVFVMTFWFAWRYRASNPGARYQRDWTSGRIDAVTWAVPALIVISLGVHVWIYTHRLDPYRRLAGAAPPLEVQVVAQDWKWLFIYPEQAVAAVNELAFPSDRQLALTITSDTVMNSFYVPALGGQIYAMAGMRTRLHLAADAPGHFVGRNTQYSGNGFALQSFDVRAMTAADFDTWVGNARAAGPLDATTYAELVRPSKAHPVTYYSDPDPGLFDAIVRKYAGIVPQQPQATAR